MYADTITLAMPVLGNVIVTRINQDNFASEYQFRDSTHQVNLRIRHTKVTDKKRNQVYDRHNVEVARVIFATATVPEFAQKCYMVWETLPSDGAQATPGALAAWMQASSPANLAKLAALES